MKLTIDDIYIGTDGYWRKNRSFVLGHEFGPILLCVHSSIEEAIHEWDERHGRRVDMDDPDLLDYGTDPESAVNAAVDCGDIRINDGGAVVWVDHYEWIREFPNPREAGQFYRSWGSCA